MADFLIISLSQTFLPATAFDMRLISIHQQNCPVSLPQTQSFESNKPDPGKFYEEIIKDSMSGSSIGNSQNPEVRRLHGKASTLAATALATTTKATHGRAWGRFTGFCAKMGHNPMEI